MALAASRGLAPAEANDDLSGFSLRALCPGHDGGIRWVRLDFVKNCGLNFGIRQRPGNFFQDAGVDDALVCDDQYLLPAKSLDLLTNLTDGVYPEEKFRACLKFKLWSYPFSFCLIPGGSFVHLTLQPLKQINPQL